MRSAVEERITDLLDRISITDKIASELVELVYLLIIIAICAIIYVFTRKIVVRVLRKIILNSPYKWDNVFLNKKFVHRSLNVIPAVILYYTSFLLPTFQNFVELVAVMFIIFTVTSALFGFLDAINCIYEENHSSSRQRPIKGFLQIVKIFIFAVALIVVISRLLGQSPVYLLGGIGALSAVILLVFQNSILGMVAGVQMASNDMVRIGDWIEMPKYGADGDVIDISLTVVKVENFDRTITTIPAHAFISDSFKNWRGMQDSGGRRIKRSVYIDASSVEFCTENMIQEYSKIQYLKEYIGKRQEEIRLYNEEHKIDPSSPVNGRRLTNIGVFRKYAEEYIENHPKIHKGMIKMVRQLAPGKEGIPLEIYAFTNDTNWINYECIMADIFDHLLAVVPYFNLTLFQEPTGKDIRSIGKDLCSR